MTIRKSAEVGTAIVALGGSREIYNNTLAQSLVPEGRGEESECYAVFTEALCLHRSTLPLGSFQIFPQLCLPWKPGDPSDR